MPILHNSTLTRRPHAQLQLHLNDRLQTTKCIDTKGSNTAQYGNTRNQYKSQPLRIHLLGYIKGTQHKTRDKKVTIQPHWTTENNADQSISRFMQTLSGHATLCDYQNITDVDMAKGTNKYVINMMRMEATSCQKNN
eukprot:5622934-Amphidinium_carterae.1